MVATVVKLDAVARLQTVVYPVYLAVVLASPYLVAAV
jgi:hypothetical protein